MFDRLLRYFGLKPGWCILHAGEREPCFKCNSAVRRSGVRRA